MSNNIFHITYQWLRYLQIPVSKTYLKEQILSHPDYPSLLSITDSLDELGIKNAAFVVDKERLHELPVPFLVHTAAQGGEFVLVKSTSVFASEKSNSYKNWNGLIVTAENFYH